MKISIVGFTQYENLGDQLIGKTVDYLVKQYAGNNGTKLIDFSYDKSKGNASIILRVLWKVTHQLKLELLSDYLLVKKYGSYYKKTIFKEIAETDGLIFCGGSFKYGTQDVWARYSAIVDYANKHNIPVMFDAMNVQKFDGKNFKCRYLKKHLNKKCVKYFTSRDGDFGVERLKHDYIDSGDLQVLPAADPAFWVPETYRVKRNADSNIVGVNVIAPDRFQAYGGKLQPSAVKAAYIRMLDRLTENGFSWQLFTNGMYDDNNFARELAEYYNLSDSKIRIPKSDTELVNMEANYKAVFGSRLHSMICAYSLNVPVAGFIWDEKITHFAEMAKLEDLFLKEDEITGDAMYEVLVKSLYKEDNPENREFWKHKTKDTIFDFLKNI